MNCHECNLLMWDGKCWRNGKRRGANAVCQWTLKQQERWYRQCGTGDYSTAPMAENIRMRREKEGAE